MKRVKIVWTVEQEKFLRDHLNDMSLQDLGMHCEDRSFQAIKHKLAKLGLKKANRIYSDGCRKTWTKKEDQFLKDHINELSVKELEEYYGTRNRNSIKGRVKTLKLSRSHKVCPKKYNSTWNTEQEMLLRENVNAMPVRELGMLCGHPKTSTVWNRIRRLGLNKDSRTYDYRNKFCKGKPNPNTRGRMLRLWRSGYFATKFYPFPAPNKAEDKLLAVIQELELPFRYVGDWKYQVGTLNPDFVHMSKPICIDLFGTYWHSTQRRSKDKRASYFDADVREKEFNENGHELLVIYEKELRDLESLRNKLVEYANA